MCKSKTVIFLGSSVTDGDDGYSMCEFVKEQTGYNVIKWAVRGTTLADLSENSYVKRLMNNMETQDTCDCFICQLSTNDASKDSPLGAIGCTTDIEDLDTSTVIGAIEFIIATVRKKWCCPILFYTGTYMDNKKYQDMVDALLSLKQKWGFEIIDLWNSQKMRSIKTDDYTMYMKDPVHPSKLGYKEWWGPEFISAIKEYIND